MRVGAGSDPSGAGAPTPTGPGLSRRVFLAGTAAALVGARLAAQARPSSAAPLPVDPFTLGVASGDPGADGFVLWTRLAPDPTNGGGMGGDDVAVTWQVATDEAFADVVASGTEPAVAALAHSVHAEVTGLPADSWFWYRFSVEGWTSPSGRARTTPAAGSAVPLRFGFASCQSYGSGYYTAHRALAAEQCDLVFWLGDYIYEGSIGGSLRPVPGTSECLTLDDYRNRYGIYKSDVDLQASHRMCPWVVTWDDHEVDNDYAGPFSEEGVDQATFLARRAAAYQAWYEHQPVRLDPPSGPDFRIHRRLEWGDVATFHVLDTRQYRTAQPCGGGGLQPGCEGQDDPDGTILGAAQESWLLDGISGSGGVWQVLAQAVIFAPLPLGSGFNMDQWDGYRASRGRVWDALSGVANPLVITGDIHAAGHARLHRVLDDATTDLIGNELVGTSISSGFSDVPPEAANAVIAGIPWIEYVNAGDRGYTVVDMTTGRLTARYRVVSTVQQTTAEVRTDHVVEVEARTAPVPPPTTTPPAVPEAPPAAPVEAEASFTG